MLNDLLHDDLEVTVLREWSEVLDDVPVPQGRVQHDLFVQGLDIAEVLFRDFLYSDADLSVQVSGRVDNAVRAFAEDDLPLVVIEVVFKLKILSRLEQRNWTYDFDHFDAIIKSIMWHCLLCVSGKITKNCCIYKEFTKTQLQISIKLFLSSECSLSQNPFKYQNTLKTIGQKIHKPEVVQASDPSPDLWSFLPGQLSC